MSKRDDLEARAEKLKLSYPHNLGDEKLEERIRAAEAAQATAGNTLPNGDAQTGQAQPKGDPQSVLTEKTVVVVGPAKGRWRAGRHFTPERTLIPASELSSAEAHALAHDPELLVTMLKPDTI